MPPNSSGHTGSAGTGRGDVHDDRAREILAGGGARVDGIRVRIPEYLVEDALRKAPRRMSSGRVAMRAHDYNTYFGGGSDCMHVLDHHTGQRRATGADVERCDLCGPFNGCPA